jgi:3-hydroxyphenylacetate 6-hydroxylase
MAIATVLSALQGRVIQSPWQSLGIATLILPLLYVIINEFVRSSARVKGMQGPTGLPLIGNLAQIRTNAAEQYRIWSRKFGPVYQIQLGNIPVVVVNSAAAAKVLFGHNAQALSSRPEFYTFHKVSRESSCPSTLVSCMRLA